MKGWNKRRCGEKCDDGQNDDDHDAAAADPSLLRILLREVVALAFMRQGFSEDGDSEWELNLL